MKRIISKIFITVIVIIITLSCGQLVFAVDAPVVINSGICGNTANYAIYDDGTMLIYGTGKTTDYSSTSTVPWEDYKNKIKKVVIDEQITGLGAYSFWNNSSITSVEINANNITLGKYCFMSCSALTSIDFGTGTVIPGTQVFKNCDSLESVTIPAGVSMTKEPGSDGMGNGSGMFSSCDKLANVTIDCAFIGQYMFESNPGLNTITFTNKDTELYGVKPSDMGYPFNGINNEFSIIGYECSYAHVVADNNSKISFVQIDGDTTSHDTVTDEAKTATCTESGLTEGSHCSKCGLVLQAQTIVPTAGHTYGNLIPEKPATCDAAGMLEHYQCSVCKKLFDADKKETTGEALVIEAKGHNYGDLITEVPATCEEAGTAAYYQCSVCDKYFDKDKKETNEEALVIEAKGHSFGDLIAEVPATCESAGTAAHYQCSECNKLFDSDKSEVTKEKLIIKAKGHILTHNKQAAGYMKNGYEYDTCNVCHKKFNNKILAGWSTSYVKSFKIKKGKKCFTAKWKKQSKKKLKLFNGYQLRYSTKANMSGAKYKNIGKSKKSVKIKGLGKKTKYYVQLRTYKNGFYSKWSTKTVVTK